MECEWISLAECASHIVDNRGRTCPVGKTGIPLIATNCLRSETLYPTYETERFVSAETYASWFRGHPVAGDIIFVRKGSPGRVCLTPDPVDFCIAQDMVAIRADERLVSQRYLFAVLRSAATRRAIDDLQVGTMIPHFKKGDFDKLMLPIPSRPLQQAIGDLHFELCERIDLLRQTNATLEAIAQALFKSWFVDFDPVHAKVEGREPETMDAATAPLFPSEFEASELGPIPKEWRIRSIYDIASVRYGAPFASSKFNTEGNGLPLVRIRDLRAEQPGVWTQEVHPKGYLIQPGDIIVGMDGEFRAHLWGGEPAWMNQRVCVFHPIAPHCNVFVRNAIGAPLAQVEATETATTVIHLGKGDIDQFNVIVPGDEIAAAFAAYAQPLYDKIVSAKQQARNLADLRDTLLPRLISGKLHLPEATEAAEDAVA